MNSEESFKCILCNDSFNDKETLQTHFRKHGDPSYNTKPKLNKPEDVSETCKVKSGTEAELVNCDVCSEMFPTISKAITHKHKMHPNHDSKYFCCWCGKLFTMKHLYNKHLTSHTAMETTGEVYNCDPCGVEFYLISAMLYHNKFFHRQEAELAGIGHSKKQKMVNQELVPLYYCCFCGEEFINKVNLYKHIPDDHHDENQNPSVVQKCPLCDAVFYHLDAYEVHLTFHSQEDIYTTSESIQDIPTEFNMETVPPICENVVDNEDTEDTIDLEQLLQITMDEQQNKSKHKKHKKHKKSKKSAITLDEFLNMNKDMFGEEVDVHGIEEVPSQVVNKSLKIRAKPKNPSEMTSLPKADIEKLKQCGVTIKNKTFNKVSIHPGVKITKTMKVPAPPLQKPIRKPEVNSQLSNNEILSKLSGISVVKKNINTNIPTDDVVSDKCHDENEDTEKNAMTPEAPENASTDIETKDTNLKTTEENDDKVSMDLPTEDGNENVNTNVEPNNISDEKLEIFKNFSSEITIKSQPKPVSKTDSNDTNSDVTSNEDINIETTTQQVITKSSFKDNDLNEIDKIHATPISSDMSTYKLVNTSQLNAPKIQECEVRIERLQTAPYIEFQDSKNEVMSEDECAENKVCENLPHTKLQNLSKSLTIKPTKLITSPSTVTESQQGNNTISTPTVQRVSVNPISNLSKELTIKSSPKNIPSSINVHNTTNIESINKTFESKPNQSEVDYDSSGEAFHDTDDEDFYTDTPETKHTITQKNSTSIMISDSTINIPVENNSTSGLNNETMGSKQSQNPNVTNTRNNEVKNVLQMLSKNVTIKQTNSLKLHKSEATQNGNNLLSKNDEVKSKSVPVNMSSIKTFGKDIIIKTINKPSVETTFKESEVLSIDDSDSNDSQSFENQIKVNKIETNRAELNEQQSKTTTPASGSSIAMKQNSQKAVKRSIVPVTTEQTHSSINNIILNRQANIQTKIVRPGQSFQAKVPMMTHAQIRQKNNSNPKQTNTMLKDFHINSSSDDDFDHSDKKYITNYEPCEENEDHIGDFDEVENSDDDMEGQLDNHELMINKLMQENHNLSIKCNKPTKLHTNINHLNPMSRKRENSDNPQKTPIKQMKEDQEFDDTDMDSRSTNSIASNINKQQIVSQAIKKNVRTVATKTIVEEITTTVTRTIKTVNHSATEEISTNQSQMKIASKPNTEVSKFSSKVKPGTQIKNFQSSAIRPANPGQTRIRPTLAANSQNLLNKTVSVRPARTPIRAGIRPVIPSGTVAIRKPLNSANAQSQQLKISPYAMKTLSQNKHRMALPPSGAKHASEHIVSKSQTSTSLSFKSNTEFTSMQKQNTAVSKQVVQKTQIQTNTQSVNTASSKMLEAIQKLQMQGLVVKKPTLESNFEDSYSDCDEPDPTGLG